MFLCSKRLTDAGEPEQFLRAHYGVFQPDFLFFEVFVGFWFKVNLLRSEISGSFQEIEIVTDLQGCKQPPDFTDEGRHLGSEQGIALGRVQEGEEFLADQIVQRALQAELFADTFFVTRTAAEAQGYAVEGLAPTSRAARQLGEAGVETGTLQGFLAGGTNREASEKKHFYFVDESSLASTNQIRDFLNRLRPQHRVLLIDDTRH